ncbi:MAG: tetratricopeptide repeat protein [Nevskia sp.]|nr:tetratricopeptide repeat protein [Nevskia sp.]
MRDIGTVDSGFDQSPLIRLVLGETFAAQGKHLAATKELENALRISTGSYGPDHFGTRRIRLALAKNAAATGDAAAIERYLSQPAPLQFAEVADGHSLKRDMASLRTVTATSPSAVAINDAPRSPEK